VSTDSETSPPRESGPSIQELRLELRDAEASLSDASRRLRRIAEGLRALLETDLAEEMREHLQRLYRTARR